VPELAIDRATTALVVIDLQKGIGTQPTKPYSFQDVVKNAAKLVVAFRKHRMPVVLVHIVATEATMLKVTSDVSFSRSGPLPPDWSEFVPEIAPVASDIVIGKKQWGAFYGTDLELQLRRRGIRTIVLSGVSTDIGVESTARFAYEYGFQQIFAEDAMSSMSTEQHNAAVNFIFKRMGRVRKTDEIDRRNPGEKERYVVVVNESALLGCEGAEPQRLGPPEALGRDLRRPGKRVAFRENFAPSPATISRRMAHSGR